MSTKRADQNIKAQHPTILIGYGRYGLLVLQSLLSGAAARGVLTWDESSAAILRERKLRTLALFWIPDLLDLEKEPLAEDEAGDNFEMMQDLYQQIERLEPGTANPGRLLAELVEEAKIRLFSEPLLTASRDEIGVGLDVILVAQPTHSSVLGKLRQVLSPVLNMLAADPGLTSPADGQDLLNLIEILDFDNFWDPSARQSSVRDALIQGLESDAHATGMPGFGRVYLFDGRTERGNQEESFRRQQAVLFVEFLVFEGHRSSVSLRTFYQREQRDVSALCVLGARGIEHSTALLRRLAAAGFARGWLEYLGGKGPAGAKPVLAGLLEPFSPSRIDATLAAPSLEALIRRGLEAIEIELMAIDPADDNWPELVAGTCGRLVEDWTTRVRSEAETAASEVLRQNISSLYRALVAAADQALNSRDLPTTVGAILDEIDKGKAELDRLPVQAAARPALETVSRSLLVGVHRDYLAARRNQVRSARLKTRWWPVAAIGAAVALLPISQETLDGFTAGPLPPWAKLAGLSVSLTAAFWIGGVALYHPRIAGRVERALNFHTDPERGRRANAIRKLVASESVEGQLRAAADRALHAQRLRVTGEVAGALERLRTPLAERKREMEWLQLQLHDYLSLHGVDTRSPALRLLPNRRQNQVLRSLESEADLQAIADGRPSNSSEYRAQQRELQIFAGWDQAYFATFLEPHQFLDRLVKAFPVPEWKENSAALQRLAGGIVDSLASGGAFPTSFYWLHADGLPPQSGYCSLPEHWLRLPDVDAELQRYSYRERMVKRQSGERMYLLQARLAVPADLLRRK